MFVSKLLHHFHTSARCCWLPHAAAVKASIGAASTSLLDSSQLKKRSNSDESESRHRYKPRLAPAHKPFMLPSHGNSSMGRMIRDRIPVSGELSKSDTILQQQQLESWQSLSNDELLYEEARLEREQKLAEASGDQSRGHLYDRTMYQLKTMNSLRIIRKQDPFFTKEAFLTTATQLYNDCLAAMAKGDLLTLRHYLNPRYLSSIKAQVKARRNVMRLSSSINRLCDMPKIVAAFAAQMEDSSHLAQIIVRFTSEQVLTEPTGVMSTYTVTEHIVFGREITNLSPTNWRIYGLAFESDRYFEDEAAENRENNKSG